MSKAKRTKFVGIKEIAVRMDFSTPRAHKLSKSVDFPDPYQRLACGPIWDERDVETFFRNRWGTW